MQKSRQSAKLSLQSSELGLSQPLTRLSPFGSGGRGTPAGKRGVGESQFRRGDIHSCSCSTLYIYIYIYIYIYVFCDRCPPKGRGRYFPIICSSAICHVHGIGAWELGKFAQGNLIYLPKYTNFKCQETFKAPFLSIKPTSERDNW